MPNDVAARPPVFRSLQGGFWAIHQSAGLVASLVRSQGRRGASALRKLLRKTLRECAGAMAMGVFACVLSVQQVKAAENFIQLYIEANHGCGNLWDPISTVLTGQDIHTPFGKPAAEWSDDDMALLKAVLNACQVTAARSGNPDFVEQIKRDSDGILARMPAIVSRARDEAQAQNQEIEARRQLAASRIDKATEAKQRMKASAEAEVAQLENEATSAEAEADAAQRRANAQIERASRARDEAKAKVAAIASLERSVQENGGRMPRVRQAPPGELSELVPDDDQAGAQAAKSPALITATTAVDSLACNTIDALMAGHQQVASPQDKASPAPSPSGACSAVAKGTRVTIQAAGAGMGLKAFCVALEGHSGCLWMAKAALGATDQQ